MRFTKGIFVVSACLSLLFLSSVTSESLAACSPSPAVKIDGQTYAPTSIQDAYDYASGLGLPNFTLKLAGEVFTEDLVLDGGAVVFDGGYDCSFAVKTSPSGILGTMTITTGSAIFAGDVRVVSSAQLPQCVVDVDGDGYSVDTCTGVADDCNDDNASIHPGAVEIPYNGIDEDCNGSDLNFDGEWCWDCHNLSTVDDRHDLTTAPDSTCVSCHAPEVANVLPGHYGNTVRTAGNYMAAGSIIGCEACHDASAILHSGGVKIGDGSNLITNKIVSALPNITCDTCHETRASLHATTTAHNNRIIDTSCANCHTSDTTALGSPGTGTLASAADVDALHKNNCALCHNYTGIKLNAATVRQTIQQGLNGTQVTCINCHTDKGTNHGAFTHPISVGPSDLSAGTACGVCHVVANWTEIETIEHNVATNGAGSCATCHNSPRQEVIDTIAAGVPANCLDCHLTNAAAHGSIDHVAMSKVILGSTTCVNCHDPGTTANATVAVTHKNNCSLCHTANIPELLPGLGVGDCAACHTNTWEVIHTVNTPSHTSLVQVAATSCRSCHSTPPPLTNAADPKVHNTCATCHDADGGLIKSAFGQDFITGGDCITCHAGTWDGIHNTVNTPNHTPLVQVASTSCADCHDNTFISAANNTHNGCSSCHDANGVLSSTAVGSFDPGGDCTTCHTTGFAPIHAAHAHIVSEGAGDLSYEPPGILCSNCHVVSNWTEIEGTEHNVATNGAGSCATCHNSLRQEVKDAIANVDNLNPITCLDCHSNKLMTVHGNVNHVGSGYVTGETACLVCHVDPAITFTDSGNNKVHNGCTSCHDAATNALKGSAIGHAVGPNTCTTCHTGRDWTDHNINHAASGYVSLHSECTSCHATTLSGIGTAFINPANDEKHNACTSCHAADGAIATGSVNCSACHSGVTTDWATHAENHTGKVTQATGCASCHSATVDYVNFVDLASNLKHDNCYVCHSATTKLASAAAGTCANCHSGVTGDFTTHITQDHTTKVTLQAQCSGCHTATVDYANFIDAANVKKHDSCTSCHNVDTNAPAQPAGDCSQCHGTNYFNSHSHIHDVGYNPATDTSQSTQQGCAACHNDSGGGLLTYADIVTEHRNDCATCHFYTDDGQGTPVQLTVETTIATGTSVSCATCHTAKVPNTDHGVNHIGSGLVTGEAACLVCHADPATTFTDSNDAKVHNGCTTCHDATTNALKGSAIGHAVGPNTCTTCHTGRDWTDHNINHAASGYVSLHSECTSCHATTLSGIGTGFINPANDEKHNACTSCHAADGAIATGSVNCSACHSGVTTDWATHAENHTGKVTQATGCASCHSATVDYVNFVDLASNLKHDNCYVCHDNTTKLASAAAGTCANCHSGVTGNFATHISQDHTTAVTLQAECTGCHNVTVAAPITDAANVKKHDNCTNCHNATTNAAIQPAGNCAQCHTPNYFDSHDHLHTVSLGASDLSAGASCDVCHASADLAEIATLHDVPTNGAGTCATCHNSTTPTVMGVIAAGNPTNCLDCHTDKNVAHGSVDHITPSFVTGEAACLVCHIDPATTFTDPANDKVHDGCATCHNTTTYALIGSAIGQEGGPNTCTSCHTGRDWTDHNIDHAASGYVSLHSECTSCHATTLSGIGTAFINPANDEKHNACTSCHAADGAIATGSVNCSACHSGVTTDWATHAEDHTGKVTQATGCASCHNATVDYVNFVDLASNLKHDNCYVCHDNTTKLASAAAGTCANCHSGVTGNFSTHLTQDHTTAVTLQAECTGCHNVTVAAPITDATNVKKHDNCTNCHNATTNAPTAAAGNCAQCHTPNYFDSHAHSHTVALGAGDTSNGTSCGSCHVVANWTQINGTEHNVATNGAGSCATCHNSPRTDVINAINTGANPTNCLTCHSDKTAAHGSIDHAAEGYVTLTNPCSSCHTGATVEVTHSNNCNLCHTTVPALQSGVPAGGGSCVTCHGSDVGTVHPSCTTCHGEPPNGSSSPNRERAHSEHAVLGFGSTSPSCSACHSGASHNGSTQVSILSSFDDKSSGSPSFNGSSCSNLRCHGGKTTPNWATGSLNANTQCESCHGYIKEGGTPEYNTAYSGYHYKHMNEYDADCTDCHSASKLAIGSGGNTHFSNLQSTTFELSPGLTIGGSDTLNLGWRSSDQSCSAPANGCHGERKDW